MLVKRSKSHRIELFQILKAVSDSSINTYLIDKKQGEWHHSTSSIAVFSRVILQTVLHSSHQFAQKEAQLRPDLCFCRLFGKVLKPLASTDSWPSLIPATQWQALATQKTLLTVNRKAQGCPYFLLWYVIQGTLWDDIFPWYAANLWPCFLYILWIETSCRLFEGKCLHSNWNITKIALTYAPS